MGYRDPTTSDNERPFYQPPTIEDCRKHPNTLSLAFQNLFEGKLNAIGEFEFETSPQVVEDPRVSPFSCILLAPMVAAPALIVSEYGDREFTVTWTGGPVEGSCRYVVLG